MESWQNATESPASTSFFTGAAPRGSWIAHVSALQLQILVGGSSQGHLGFGRRRPMCPAER